MRPKGSAAVLESRRKSAVDLLRSGLTQTAVAAMVKASQGSVSRWWKVYRVSGDTGLLRKIPPGGRPKLKARQISCLDARLRKGQRRRKVPTLVTKLKTLRRTIQRLFRVRLHLSSVSRLVRRLGFRLQLPERKFKGPVSGPEYPDIPWWARADYAAGLLGDFPYWLR